MYFHYVKFSKRSYIKELIRKKYSWCKISVQAKHSLTLQYATQKWILIVSTEFKMLSRINWLTAVSHGWQNGCHCTKLSETHTGRSPEPKNTATPWELPLLWRLQPYSVYRFWRELHTSLILIVLINSGISLTVPITELFHTQIMLPCCWGLRHSPGREDHPAPASVASKSTGHNMVFLWPFISECCQGNTSLSLYYVFLKNQNN